MRPIRLTIPGEYWDSHIYSGRLYLFGRSGDIITLDWDSICEKLKIDESLRLAFSVAFQRSDLLYQDTYEILSQDREVKNIVVNKLSRLASMDLSVSSRQMNSVLLGRQDNRFPFPHTDSEIYKRVFYVSSKSGVYVANCHRRKMKYPISTRPEKKWDAPVLAMSANYGTLALATGNEGLFEMNLNTTFEYLPGEDTAKLVSKNNSVDCNFTFYSIYSSSHTNAGYLASYEKISEEAQDYRLYRRKFKSVILEDAIFQGSGYSWGVQDKLYQARDGHVQVVRYYPWNDEDNQFESLGVLELAPWKGEVVSGGVGFFGVIIECENAIVVLPSKGRPITFRGEPVNWRIFPRSKFYENQLHIIYNDRIEILSFNHDYLVDQKMKKAGIEVLRAYLR